MNEAGNTASTADDYSIEFDHVSRNYGAKVAVAQLDLSIRRGEIFAFLGPNGAGKTTSIKMMVGLLQPSEGAVRICGYDVAREPRKSSACIGYVPDEPHLYDKLTGREFFDFVARMYGIARDDARRRIDREIERFQLQEFVDNTTESYSHGMKQRTVFAASLLHEPQVLIVDEPMVGLDPHSIRLVKDLLRQHAASGGTVFLSTHILSVAEEVAHRIAILREGELVFCGAVSELQAQAARPSHPLESLYLELLDGAPEHSTNGESAGAVSKTSPSRE
jgi:ABC-2 type transport system ATP-binding protein